MTPSCTASRHKLENSNQPDTPTDRFLAHTLAVAELYVSLAEAGRTDVLTLIGFHGEPACWWRDSEGEWIKPDASAVVSAGDIEDSWVIEVDNATESLPTLRRKLAVYVGLAKNEEHGPDGGPLPRVLVTVPDERRLAAVRELVRSLPEPAGELFAVTIHGTTVEVISKALHE
ncbi:hypothetical protein Psuf_014270 [Phytohabitans suffuscus]|uniref:Uncharacterized protein n=1 Tax=Phytohabitans suffuscus TaxID=624315 RepID=A0A6F8YDA3_9ACTN|nr:hypothetical protein Psuf_014270 [Phytohabitans suffuscus]